MRHYSALVLVSIFIVSCGSSNSGNSSVTIPVNDSVENDLVVISEPVLIVPAITSISPNILFTGVDVKISGSHLGDTNITLNGASVELISQAEHEIIFVAPQWPAGKYSLVVEGPEGQHSQILAYADNFKGVSASPGNNHTCAITEDATVACWGNNSNGQVGQSFKKQPVMLP